MYFMIIRLYYIEDFLTTLLYPNLSKLPSIYSGHLKRDCISADIIPTEHPVLLWCG